MSVISSHKQALDLTSLRVQSSSKTNVHGGRADNNSADTYRQELEKLLQKSHGSAFEEKIRSFVEKKLAERQREEAENVDNNFDATASQYKLDLKSMSTSRYDVKTDANIEKPPKPKANRIEELSKPHENQMWKGPYVGYGQNVFEKITTNHLGRQRPPPRNESPFVGRRSRSRSRDTALEENPILTSSEYTKQSVEFHSEKPKVISVSLDSFNQWIQEKKQWQEQSQKKIEQIKCIEDRQSKRQATPKINKKSEELCVKSYSRELEKATQIQQSMENPLLLTNTLETENNQVTPSVFTRLATYSDNKSHRIRETFNRRNESPMKVGTFTPTINERSREMAETFRNKQVEAGRRSPTPWRDASPRPRESFQRTPQFSRKQRHSSLSTLSVISLSPENHDPDHAFSNGLGSNAGSPVPPPPPLPPGEHKVDPTPRVTLSLNLDDLQILPSKNDALITTPDHRRSQQHEHGSIRRSRSTSRERIMEGYEFSRRRSMSAQRKRESDQGKENIFKQLSARKESKPFQPTNFAPKTSEIAAKQLESFDDRLARSVDNFKLRKVLSGHAFIPGPGHYPALKIEVVTGTPRKYKKDEKEVSSPGKRGYSFGRTSRKEVVDPIPKKSLDPPSIDVLIASTRISHSSQLNATNKEKDTNASNRNHKNDHISHNTNNTNMKRSVHIIAPEENSTNNAIRRESTSSTITNTNNNNNNNINNTNNYQNVNGMSISEIRDDQSANGVIDRHRNTSVRSELTTTSSVGGNAIGAGNSIETQPMTIANDASIRSNHHRSMSVMINGDAYRRSRKNSLP